MRWLFISVLALGLVLGVISMMAGIDRNRRHGNWIKFLNLPTAGTAAALFGIVGYPLAKYSSLGPAAMVAIAGAVALAGAAGMVGIIAGWAVPSAAREVEDERYRFQGFVARVTRIIPATEPGEIAFEHDGIEESVAARSADGTAIPANADVVIERIEDGVAYVELWSNIERQLELPS
jgi:hypothetical protein